MGEEENKTKQKQPKAASFQARDPAGVCNPDKVKRRQHRGGHAPSPAPHKMRARVEESRPCSIPSLLKRRLPSPGHTFSGPYMSSPYSLSRLYASSTHLRSFMLQVMRMPCSPGSSCRDPPPSQRRVRLACTY